MLFRGRFNNSIDSKGRASIPAKFREVLSAEFGDECVVVTELDEGLAVYPKSEWDRIEAGVEALPDDEEIKDDLFLTLISPAVECSFDKQGRIQLTEALREFAGLGDGSRDVVVVGVARKLMIWSKATHDEMRSEAAARIKSNKAQIKKLGF